MQTAGWPSRITSTFRTARRTPLLQVLKSLLAVALAWIAASAIIGGPPPVFAGIAALLVVQPSVNQSLAKGVERSVGVIAGVLIASGLVLVFGGQAWAALAAVAAGLLLAWIMRMTPGSANQIAISALLVVALGASAPEYAVDRIVESIIGAIIGFLINLVIVPPVVLAPAQESVGDLIDEAAASMDRLADGLTHATTAAERTDLLLQARLMRPMLDRTVARIDAAEDSLMLNPRARSRRTVLAGLRDALAALTPLITQVIGMTRAFADLATPGLEHDPGAAAIAESLRRAAHDLRLLHGRISVDEPPAEDPALTRPLRVLAPDPEHWVLVGSLMVDMERIRAGVVEATDDLRPGKLEQ